MSAMRHLLKWAREEYDVPVPVIDAAERELELIERAGQLAMRQALDNAARDERDAQLLAVVEGMRCAVKDFGEEDPHVPAECPMCALERWATAARATPTPPFVPLSGLPRA